MADPLEQFFQGDFSPDYSEQEMKEMSRTEAATPNDLESTFRRGVQTGFSGMATDWDYFKGLVQTGIGDDEGAADNIRRARVREESAAGAFGALQDFEEFTQNPSFGGFLTQVSKSVGQVSPYLLSTVSSGLGGAAITAVGKGAISATNRQVTKRLVKDAFDKKLKGAATPEEERILALSYRLAQRNALGKTADKMTLGGGMRTGMFGQEYTSMAGSNFGENLEVEGISDDEAALRAAGLAIPQAFVGLKGEEMLRKMLFKDLASVASKRSTKQGSTLANYAKEISKNTLRGGLTEGAAETIQEGMGIANRFSIDEDYTEQEALMRIGESAFAGFFGGAGISAAGGTAVSGIKASADVMGKAKDFIEEARARQVNTQIDADQYGTDSVGFTTPEPQSSVIAQIRAMLDTSTDRDSVWVAGDQPVYDATDQAVSEVEIEGERFYTRFIPGRGTIMSRYADVVDEIAKSEASDESLAIALKYGTTKPEGADIVIEALDGEGNVVWQEAATEDTATAAYEAASKQVPKGGSVRRLTIEEALENRKKAYEKEQGPRVRNMDVPQDVRDAFSDDTDESATIIEDEGTSDEEAQFGLGMNEMSPVELKNVGGKERYAPTDGTIYKNTEALREAFAEVFFEEFGEIDWSVPNFSTMSDALLRQSVRLKRENPETDIFVQRNEDGSFSIMQGVSPETQIYSDSRFETGADLDEKDLILDEEGKPVEREPEESSPRIDSAPINIYFGTGENSNLSNLAYRPFEYRGYKFLSVEHAYQTLKSGQFDQVTYDAYNRLSSARVNGRKIVGKKSAKTRDGYNLVLMEKLIEASFAQNPEAKEALLNTGSARLTHNQDRGIWRREFPRIMTEIRSRFQKDTTKASTPKETRRKPKLANTISQFLRSAIAKAATSDWAKQKLGGKKTKANPKGWQLKDKSELVTVDGKAINLVDLANEGQRMVSVEEKTQFTEDGPQTAKRNGLYRILGELISRGSVIKIGDQVLDNDTLNQLIRDNKQYRQAIAAFFDAEKRGDTDAVYPEQSEFLQKFDVLAGFADEGKKIPLGKLLGTTPNRGAGRDTQYRISKINADGTVSTVNSFSGNIQEATEFLEGRETDGWKIEKTQWNASKKQEEQVEISYEDFAGEDKRGTPRGPEVGFQDTYKDEQADGTSETERMADNTAESLDPNQEKVFGGSNPGATAISKRFGLSAKSLASKISNIARRTLRLKKPVSIFTAEGLLNADGADLKTLFTDPKVAAYMQQVARELKDNPEGSGRYVGFADAHIIVVDEAAMQNDLQTALTVAHELGHALYNEQLTDTLKNPALYNRLFSAFEKARDAKDAPEVYRGKRGFEEWYADQTATWAQKIFVQERRKQGKRTIESAAGSQKEDVRGLVAAHFKKMVRQLQTFHRALSRELKARFGREAYTAEFDSYVDAVLERNRIYSEFVGVRTGAKAATMPNFEQKVIVRKMAEAIDKQQPDMVEGFKAQARKVIRSKNFDPIYNFLFGADSRLRKVAGSKLADMFYGRAQEAGKGKTRIGMLKAAALEGNAWVNRLEDMLDGDLDSPDVKAAIDEAFGDTKTAELSGNALQVRKFFERIYDEYIEPSNTDIARREDYAPVVLKLSEIHANPGIFVAVIMAANPDQNVKQVTAAVQRLVEYQQAVRDDKPIDLGDKVNPARAVEEALKLTRNVPREELAKAGFLEDSDVALMRYISHVVKRVEWNRHTKDTGGNSIFDEEMNKLSKQERQEAQKIINVYLGYNTEPLGPMWRKVNSVGMVLQIFAILPLAVLGSLPELAGPVIASKDFSALQVALKEIVNTVRNRDEARQLARDIGVVTSQSAANALMSQAELEWMEPNARKLTEGFFRVTLLDTFTKFTREFALTMGVKFLQKHADPETADAYSGRYLDELGLTAQDVKAWIESDQDFDSPEGKKVRLALQRFVESSTLRPNAAERPLWASDPRWALAWQLKGFFYSYSKVLLMGAKREAAARVAGATTGDISAYAGLAGAAGVFALLGIATMPLAMVGMELREYAKFGLAAIIPGVDHSSKNYFRTDDMNYGEYLGAVFDRSFAAGPITIGAQMMQAVEWGRGPFGALAVGAGPSAETIERIITDGFGSTLEHRILPTGIL